MSKLLELKQMRARRCKVCEQVGGWKQVGAPKRDEHVSDSDEYHFADVVTSYKCLACGNVTEYKRPVEWGDDDE